MPLYLKQYGERRTGTNALRALITANYEGVVVLMHILGDKHSAPVDVDALWRDVQPCADREWQLVSRATYGTLAQTTHANSARQAAELRRHAEPFARALESGAFGYLISIKNPYAWAVSIARFLQWPRAVAVERLRAECARFNEHYRAWLPLLDDARRPALLVRHEDLVCDAAGVLARVDETFATTRLAELRPIAGIARPAHWDDGPTPISRQPFDPARYTRNEYLDALTHEQRDVVTAVIDWGVMGCYGYRALEL